MLKPKLISSLKIGVAAGVGSALFQALIGGIGDIDYFRATTIGVVVVLVFFLFRIYSSQEKS